MFRELIKVDQDCGRQIVTPCQISQVFISFLIQIAMIMNMWYLGICIVLSHILALLKVLSTWVLKIFQGWKLCNPSVAQPVLIVALLMTIFFSYTQSKCFLFPFILPSPCHDPLWFCFPDNILRGTGWSPTKPLE